MWATAKKGQTTVVQPFSSPTPSDRVLKLYEMGRKNPTLAKKALKAAEDVFQNAP
jgi:sulfur transfer protein SufE